MFSTVTRDGLRGAVTSDRNAHSLRKPYPDGPKIDPALTFSMGQLTGADQPDLNTNPPSSMHPPWSAKTNWTRYEKPLHKFGKAFKTATSSFVDRVNRIKHRRIFANVTIFQYSRGRAGNPAQNVVKHS